MLSFLFKYIPMYIIIKSAIMISVKFIGESIVIDANFWFLIVIMFGDINVETM